MFHAAKKTETQRALAYVVFRTIKYPWALHGSVWM